MLFEVEYAGTKRWGTPLAHEYRVSLTAHEDTIEIFVLFDPVATPQGYPSDGRVFSGIISFPKNTACRVAEAVLKAAKVGRPAIFWVKEKGGT